MSIYVIMNVNLSLYLSVVKSLLVRLSPDHRPQIKPLLHISLMCVRLHYAEWDKGRHYPTLWDSQQYSGGSFISDTSHLLFLLRRESKGAISLIILPLLRTSGGWRCLGVLHGFIRPPGSAGGRMEPYGGGLLSRWPQRMLHSPHYIFLIKTLN